MPYCEHCGKRISDTAKFCRSCGKKVTKSSTTRAQPKRIGKPQVPPPKEEPSEKSELYKKAFRIGGFGAFIAAVGVIIFGLVFTPINIGNPTIWRLLITSSAILIGIGCILVGIGFQGFHRNYDQILGIINFIVAIFTAIIWFIAAFIIVNVSSLGSGGINTFVITIVLCLIFSGIMLILQGVNVYKSRGHIENSSLVSAQYIISIIAGIFCFSIILVLTFGLGLFLWAVAYFLLIAVFYNN